MSVYYEGGSSGGGSGGSSGGDGSGQGAVDGNFVQNNGSVIIDNVLYSKEVITDLKSNLKNSKDTLSATQASYNTYTASINDVIAQISVAESEYNQTNDYDTASKKEQDRKNSEYWKIEFNWIDDEPISISDNYMRTSSFDVVQDFINATHNDWMAGGAFYNSQKAGGVFFNELGDLNSVKFLGLNDKNNNAHLQRKLKGMANLYEMLLVDAGAKSSNDRNMNTPLHLLRNANYVKYNSLENQLDANMLAYTQAIASEESNIEYLQTLLNKITALQQTSSCKKNDPCDKNNSMSDVIYDLDKAFPWVKDAYEDVGTATEKVGDEISDFGKKVFGW